MTLVSIDQSLYQIETSLSVLMTRVSKDLSLYQIENYPQSIYDTCE